jgi:hypothetical protein
MASKLLVPLHLPYITDTPALPTSGFTKFYIKSGYLTYLNEAGTEADVVLSRPLTGLSVPASTAPILSTDTILQAFAKLQRSLSSIELKGDVAGTAAYISGALIINAAVTITLEDVLQNGNVTTQSMTVGGLAVNGPFALFNPSSFSLQGVLKIDANGNVFSDPTQLLDISDYDYDITGVRNGVNKVFKLRYPYAPETTRVYLNGIRLTLGAAYDYDEYSADEIEFMLAPESDDMITVDYKITIP